MTMGDGIIPPYDPALSDVENTQLIIDHSQQEIIKGLDAGEAIPPDAPATLTDPTAEATRTISLNRYLALLDENMRLVAALKIIAAQPEDAPDAIGVTARNIARAALATLDDPK